MIFVKEGFPRQRLVRMPADVRIRARGLPVVKDLYVTDIGHFPESRYHFVHRPHGVQTHILIYCATGRGWYAEKHGPRIPMAQGQALLLPRGMAHKYGASKTRPWQIYWMHFAGRQGDAWMAALGADAKPALIMSPESGPVIQAFEEAYWGVNQGWSDTGLLLLSTGLARMLAVIYAGRQAPGRKARHTEKRIMESIQWMSSHLDTSRSLTQLARDAGLSVPHFSALFRAQTGASPMRFWMRLRMQEACRLLVDTEDYITGIARAVGFENPFHFSRNFRLIMGTSPRAYRAEWRA